MKKIFKEGFFVIGIALLMALVVIGSMLLSNKIHYGTFLF